jgi:hypothetical protein
VESYNGFSAAERAANGAALRREIASGSVPAATGPCALCGDPRARVEYHSEDYSKPYRWTPPAAYPLCLACHRNKLHKRFAQPEVWEAFKAHVRRGGYASDLKRADVAQEFRQCVAAIRAGDRFQLKVLRPYSPAPGTEWWAGLSTKPVT